MSSSRMKSAFSGIVKFFVKYVPPITPSSPKLPDTSAEIQTELSKQESLLAQIHAEMNAGFVSKKREEQLWEVQRIITQLKRKLRAVEKRQDKSVEETPSVGSDAVDARPKAGLLVKQRKLSCSDEEPHKTLTPEALPITAPLALDEKKVTAEQVESVQSPLARGEQTERVFIDEDSGFLMVEKTHAAYTALLRLQLENQELLAWKAQLQARIGAERAEMLELKQAQQQQEVRSKRQNNNNKINACVESIALDEVEGDYERIIENYIRENALLEYKRSMLAKAIFEERRECIAIQVEMALQQF